MIHMNFETQGEAPDACLAHNQVVAGSIPAPATISRVAAGSSVDVSSVTIPRSGEPTNVGGSLAAGRPECLPNNLKTGITTPGQSADRPDDEKRKAVGTVQSDGAATGELFSAGGGAFLQPASPSGTSLAPAPADSSLRMVCMDCGAELPGSNPQGARTSHGLCRVDFDRRMAELMAA